VPVEGSADVYYADAMGYFAKAGLAVDIQSMPSSNAVAAAVLSGAVDIGFNTIDVIASAHAKNLPMVVLAPAAEYLAPETSHIAAIMLPANSPVRQAKDLNGKTVSAAGLHSFAQTMMCAWVDQNGGDSSTIKFVEIPFPALPAALAADRIDAAFAPEPFLDAARANGSRVLSYGYDAIAKHFLLTAWTSTPEWTQAHGDVVKRFASVMHETAVWANAHPAESGVILARYTKIDPAVVATMARYRFAEQMSPDLLQPLIDASAKYNGFRTFPAHELFYTPGR
jgi:NitT/TauT family transport system substrate-binding protein